MRVQHLLAVIAMASLTTSAGGYDRVTGLPFASRSEVIASNGMAATSQPLATQIALEILRQGGSAVDAVWDNENKELLGLNASGRSPMLLTLDHFRQQELEQVPYLGPLAVSVPGAVDGWFELHQRFGKSPMADILAPAIAYARNGFPVTEVIADGWAANARTRAEFVGFKEVYMPDGSVPAKGDMFRNPRLADTYERLAAEGRDAFYKGDIAREIDAYMTEQGGFLRYEDLAAHHSEWVTPASTSYRGYDVYELPPNGQGAVALQMLNILEAYDLRAMGFGSTDYIHTLVEAKKLSYEDRAKYYADMEFYNAPLDRLISKEYAMERRKLIDPQEAAMSYPAGDAALEHGDTVYLTVADKDGNMVSLIQSNYGGMGSGMTPAKLGFMLQNRGVLFSLEDGHANVYEPGKRPFHTIIPAFVMKDGKPLMSFGVMGGAMQPQGHVQILVNMIDFDMNLQEAGDAARVRHLGSSQPTDEKMTDGGRVVLESGIGEEVRQQLRERGHNIDTAEESFGGYQAIYWNEEQGVYYGASESRKDGQAAGF